MLLQIATMLMTPKQILVAIFVHGLAACVDGPNKSSSLVTMDTLANGSVIVTNHARNRLPEKPIWTLEEDLRIGSVAESRGHTFGRVAGIAIDKRGMIYVLDSHANEVRVFAPDGSLTRTIGRKGAGPGEFKRPFALFISATDELWVIDHANARYTLFDTTGTLVRTVPRSISSFTQPWTGGMDMGGTLYDVAWRATNDIRYSEPVLVRVSPSMSVDDTISFQTVRPEPLTIARANGGLLMTMNDPYAPSLVWRFDRRGFVWSGVTSRYEVVRRRLNGGSSLVVKVEQRSIPVTRLENDSALAEINRIIAAEDPTATSDRRPRIPTTKPPIVTFLVDSEGYLWIEPAKKRGMQHRFDVISPDGEYRGIVYHDGTIKFDVLPIITRHAFYAVIEDSLDIPYVVRFRINGRR